MRMLRLGVGWSAEKLSQEYRTGGAGELARTTIAKIERDMRPIKVGEVDGVARIFGLTSNDLLNLNGPKVFLSYAEHDGSTAHEVADWLGDHGFQLLPASPTAADDPGSGSADARAIDAAHAFVVLLSPSFLSSPRCQQELDLAVRRERQLLTADPPTHFIYVLQVTAEADLDDSGLSSHLLIDLPTGSDRSRDVALSKLGGSILSGARAPEVRADPPIRLHLPDSPEVLARGEELGRVLYALSNSSGASFWLVISPPGFGKSWLLGQLETKAAEPESGGWVPKMVDLRSAEAAEEAGHERHDALTLISSLFGIDPRQPSETDDDCLRRAAQNIIGNGQSRLCLLDSAELLSADNVKRLRRYLHEIYRRVQDSGREDAHLAFVAASRRDDGWRGTPSPVPSFLLLTGIGPSVVKDALEGLARRIPVVRSPVELRKDAELVHCVTEGMPELVLESLQWIRTEQWLDIDRLHKQQFLGEIIERRLLADDSLLPADDGQSAKSAKQLAAVREGMRVLVPYRFITLSHVTHHVKKELDNDHTFRDALKEADWQAEDLWQAITGTALLLPLDEPWREIHPAVRRLLYQYFYPLEAARADAHRRAAKFAAYWASQVTGQEQVTGMVESIWHEAVRLRLNSDKETGKKLVTFARALSDGVRESGAYSKAELRDYAVQRMMDDEELRSEVANVDGLFDRLIGVVADPGTADV
jgi:hypothetical protein